MPRGQMQVGGWGFRRKKRGSRAVKVKPKKAKTGWHKKLWGKVKTGYKKHVHKHVKKAIAHGKKVAKQVGTAAKNIAIDTGKQLLEESKEQAKQLLRETIDDATNAAVTHVRKHVCGAVGAGVFREEKKKLHAAAMKHFESVHKKALTHIKTGRNGAGLEEHGQRVKERFEKSVQTVQNSAKRKIAAIAGCPGAEEGEGLRMRGAGLRVGKGVRVGKGMRVGKGFMGSLSSMLKDLPPEYRSAVRKAAKGMGSGFMGNLNMGSMIKSLPPEYRSAVRKALKKKR